MRIPTVQGKRVGALASDGRRVVVCEVQGYTQVVGRRTGELYRLHTEDPATEVLIDGDSLVLVAGRDGALRAFGLIAGERRPCPAVTGVQGLRRWHGGPGERGLVASHDDGFLRTYDSAHRPIAKLGQAATVEAFDVRGTTVVVAYAGSALRAYDCRTGALLCSADEPVDAVTCVHIDGAGVVTSSLDSGVRCYEADLRSVRSTPLPDPIGRLCADPSDPRVLHGVGPEVVVRLERQTLAIVDRVSVLSSHQAFCVDALGRLVGVEGGVDGLDPLPKPPPPDPEVPDIEERYDHDMTFDKDIPGMCGTRVEVWQAGRRVTVCRWYQEEGSLKGDARVEHGMLERVDGPLVHLVMDDGPRARFDLRTRRLV